MSLRPRNGATNPGRGGDGRRRRWSESPIPRVAKRRVRMAGVPFTATCVASGTRSATTSTSIDMRTIPLSGVTLDWDDIMVAFVFAFGTGAALTPPAGWTEIASGVGTEITYSVAWIKLGNPATESYTWTRSGGEAGGGRIWAWRGAGSFTPTPGTVTETGAATGVTFPTGSGSGVMQVMAYMTAGTTGPTLVWTPPWFVAGYTYGSYSLTTRKAGYVAGDPKFGITPMSASVDGGVTSEWVTAAVGFTP